jgi:probable phosphoglycerate mutase
MGGMTQLIVIRHGETDWNLQHRFQGQIDVPLNATGIDQADRLGARMAQEPIDLLVCSDLLRARRTAEPVWLPRGLAPIVEPLWREQSFGVLEGLDVPTIRSRHPDLWNRWTRHEADYALPGGGESNRAFHARVMQALRQLVAAHPGKRVTVVTHGGVLDMLWREAQGQPLHGPRECAIPNTGINRLVWRGDSLQIVEWADDAHLAGMPAQPSTAQVSLVDET